MRRRLAAIIFTAGVAVASLVAAGTAAGAPADTGCPSGFQLQPLRFVLSQATSGFEKAIRAADENNDKYLCYKPLPEPIPLFEPTFLYEDNNVATG
ncbi:MAG: hypothetical protein LC808_33950 [Actinobacteria bacterium]|nr:hypothetical protein [Actinomycetota bacterium]